ncbi:uncharacterized protein [Typha angustifolia]|uniref:uncharacterized protein n=1 Tax=Typha angustifolia TaxID=59011 RepID=UPI003C2D5A42
MPGLLRRTSQFDNASAAGCASDGGIWSRRREDITFDHLQKFWSELPLPARQELLRIDKQTLFEQARKNLYCSRCNGLLLEVFTQIVMYGKSLQHEGFGMRTLSKSGASLIHENGDFNEAQDPGVHPWGGLATTKDGILTLLDCFICAKSLKALQRVFDSARAREHERELLYPDACGGQGRGWISRAMTNYGRGHTTRETCALHTARLTCDTLVDFWFALGDETRSSLLRMKEEDFIERLMYRFDSKRFCRDCRKNVIREFKELKDFRRMRREPRCTSSFCVSDATFEYEVSENTIQADWCESFTDTFGSYHHFEWAVGTAEGKSNILDFEDVGMNGKVHMDGLDLGGLNACFITLRAWKLDGSCTEFSVKAHALKGQACVHRRMIVGDGFVTITEGESIRRFFEHAEEAEEEDDDDAMEKDGNELDGDGPRPQKHAKSPELAREFLLDAATVIFKEQVEKAFREGTARQNAHSVFVSLALKLLEERVRVACKEIITLEKQTKLLEEEEKEKREEEERKERRRAKEREKKIRRKERLKGKEREREREFIESKSSPVISVTSLDDSLTSAHNDSPRTPDTGDSVSEQGDMIPMSAKPLSPSITDEQSLCGDANKKNMKIGSLVHQCPIEGDYIISGGGRSFTNEQSKSSKQKLRYREGSHQNQAYDWYESRHSIISNDTSAHTFVPFESMSVLHRLSKERVVRNVTRNSDMKFSAKFHCSNSRMHDMCNFRSCRCTCQADYRMKDGYHVSTARLGREIKNANKIESGLDMPRPFYRIRNYNSGCCLPYNILMKKGNYIGDPLNKDVHIKQVWEPTDARKKCNRSSSSATLGSFVKLDPSEKIEVSKDIKRSHSHSELGSLVEAHPESSRKVDGLSSHKVNEGCSKNQNTCQLGTYDSDYQHGLSLVTKSECYSNNGGEEEVNAGVVMSAFPLSNNSDSITNSSSSDNCSSCLSEGDSSTSSSSDQNVETSSASDSEDASQQSDGRYTSTCTGSACEIREKTSERNSSSAGSYLMKTAAGSPTAKEYLFSGENSTEAVQFTDSCRIGGHIAPSQQYMLPMQHESMFIPLLPSPTMEYNSKRVASCFTSTNGFLPFAQPNHFVYPTPIAYGSAANQSGSADFSSHYSALQPLTAPVFGAPQQYIYNNVYITNVAGFNPESSMEQNRSGNSCGNRHVSSLAEPTSNRHPLECPSGQLHLKLQSVGKNGGAENAAKEHNEKPSFSLFHFGGPIAGVGSGLIPKTPLSKEEINGGLASNSPAAQAHSCSKEEKSVQEYCLFSGSTGATFSFLQSSS